LPLLQDKSNAYAPHLCVTAEGVFALHPAKGITKKRNTKPALLGLQGVEMTNNQITRVLLLSTAMQLLAVGGFAAQAQDTGTVALETIVVTAEHRVERAQSTPLSITALSGDRLESQGVVNIGALSTEVPSLHSDSSGQVFLRGIGSTNLNETGDPAIAAQIDGIYLARAASLNALFFDLNRVEVLRGPQGTLYGRNATAGVINIITNRPNTEALSGSASLQYGNYDALQASGVVNIPVTDTLAIRGAFQTSRHGSYTKNTNPLGSNANDQDDNGGRLSALWKPVSWFDWYISVDVLHRGGYAAFNASSNSSAAVDLVTGSPEHPRTINSPLATNMDDMYQGLTSEMNFEVGPGRLTYLTGYRTERRDERGQNLQNNDTYFATSFHNREHELTNELRYAIELENFHWVTGLYSFDEHNSIDFRVGSPSAWLTSGTIRQFLQPKVGAESQAIYSQATYDLTSKLHLTAGIRYTKDHKYRYGHIYLINAGSGAVASTVTTENANFKYDNLSWRGGVSYDIDENIMAYFNMATGYKAGGYFDGDQSSLGDLISYRPEKLQSYEGGVKSQFWNNRIQLNVTAFLYAYHDFQVSSQVMIGTPAQQAGATVNAQRARIWGFELENKTLLTDADEFDATISYLNGRYTEFYLLNGDSFSNAGLAATAARIPANFSNTKMANSPTWSGTISLQHDFRVSTGDLIARVQSHFEADNWLEYHHFSGTLQPGFTRTDISLEYTPKDSRWSISAFIRNIEDDAVKTYALPEVPSTAATPSVYSVQYAAPRLFGVRVNANY
jgi:iron complex outermembrane recepter protein